MLENRRPIREMPMLLFEVAEAAEQKRLEDEAPAAKAKAAAHSPTHSLTTHSLLTHSPTHSLLTHSLTTHSLTHSLLTHSPTHDSVEVTRSMLCQIASSDHYMSKEVFQLSLRLFREREQRIKTAYLESNRYIVLF